MEEKRLGRPKGKNKPAGAGTLLHVELSERGKEAFEYLRLCYRVEDYDVETHGEAPTALPRVRNAPAIERLLFETAMRLHSPYGLAMRLRDKGCLNAFELIGVEEGPEE